MSNVRPSIDRPALPSSPATQAAWGRQRQCASIERELLGRQAFRAARPVDPFSADKCFALQCLANGDLVKGRELAAWWGCAPDTLLDAARQRHLCSALVDGIRYYPSSFVGLLQEHVLALCNVLMALPLEQQLRFWTKQHCELRGATVHEALLKYGNGDLPLSILALAKATSRWIR